MTHALAKIKVEGHSVQERTNVRMVITNCITDLADSVSNNCYIEFKWSIM